VEDGLKYAESKSQMKEGVEVKKKRVGEEMHFILVNFCKRAVNIFLYTSKINKRRF